MVAETLKEISRRTSVDFAPYYGAVTGRASAGQDGVSFNLKPVYIVAAVSELYNRHFEFFTYAL